MSFAAHGYAAPCCHHVQKWSSQAWLAGPAPPPVKTATTVLWLRGLAIEAAGCAGGGAAAGCIAISCAPGRATVRAVRIICVCVLAAATAVGGKSTLVLG